MRTDKFRKDKYEKKIRGDVAKIRIDRYGKTQKGLFKSRIQDQVEIERKVKSLLAGKVPSNMLVYYIIFAKQLYKVIRTHKGDNQKVEIEILQKTWGKRGLSSLLMSEIKKLFGIVVEKVGYGVGGYGMGKYGW